MGAQKSSRRQHACGVTAPAARPSWPAARGRVTPHVAALYIDPRGPYPALLGREACWDETRDARHYNGPLPVVSHPPCGAYSSLRHLAKQALAHADCGPIAVEQVRRVGGVLEQPAGSKLWDACGLPKPGQPADEHGGYSIEVTQVEWGHVARKKTWLYLVRVPRSALRPPPFPGREPTHWVSGSRTAKRGPVPAGIKVCSAGQRRKTPPLFAEYLIHLAASAAPNTKAEAA